MSDETRPSALDVPYREREESISQSTIEQPVSGTDVELERGAAHDQPRPAPPGHARGAAAAVPARGRGACATSSRSSATCTPASRRAARTRSTGRPSRSSSGWTTSPTTATRWRTARRSRRCSRRRCPPRAQWLRVIHLELNRIASHLFWLGHRRAGHRRDHDALVGPARARPDPRPVRDVVGPAHPHALLPGRRRDRGHPARLGGEGAASFLKEMPTRIDQYEALLDENEIWLQRTKNTGIVSREKLLELGVTGPLLRAAGEPWDLRKAMPVLRATRTSTSGSRWARVGRQLRPLPRAAWRRCASR